MNRPAFILLITAFLFATLRADVPPDPGFVRQSIALALETDQDIKDHRFFLVSAIRLDEVKLRQGERTFVGAEGHAGAGRVVRLLSIPTANVTNLAEPLSPASAEELKKALAEKRIEGVTELLTHDFSTVVRKDDVDGPGSRTFRIERNGGDAIVAIPLDDAVTGDKKDANDLSRSSSRSLYAALIGGGLLALTAIFGGLWLLRRASRNQ